MQRLRIDHAEADHYDRVADQRRLCSLDLSLMDRIGVELPSFGDAKERLAGI